MLEHALKHFKLISSLKLKHLDCQFCIVSFKNNLICRLKLEKIVYDNLQMNLVLMQGCSFAHASVLI